jgi:nucleoside-diphosphate-sugar epimerase
LPFNHTLRRGLVSFIPVNTQDKKKPTMSQHIVVTGGCGFFGAWICKQILESHDSVTIIDVAYNDSKLKMILSSEQISQIKFVQGRVDEPNFIDTLVNLKPDAIIHLAGLQIPTCRDNPILGAKVNVIGSLAVFEAAKILKTSHSLIPRIVYASSAAVFGPDAEYDTSAPVNDSSTPKPASHYGAYKLCIEHCAKSYFSVNGIPSVGLRPLTVYGPGRDVGMTSFPTRAVAAVIKGQAFEIPFNGTTAFIHVREVADMFVTAARVAVPEARVYTVGGDHATPVEWVELLSEFLPNAKALVTVSGGSLPIASHLDDAALRAAYPTLCRIPLKQGIQETVEIFKQLEEKGTLTV